MKKNRFTGWSDGEIAEYIRQEKSIHATTCGWWAGATIGFCLIPRGIDDVGLFFFSLIIVISGIASLYSVQKSRKELLELEQRQRKDD